MLATIGVKLILSAAILMPVVLSSADGLILDGNGARGYLHLGFKL